MTIRSISRTAILSLAVLSSGAVRAQDAYLTNAYVPTFVKAGTDIPISVRVRNSATAQLVTFRVDWKWNNGAVQTGFSQTTTGISGNQYWPYEHQVPFNVSQGSGLLKIWVAGVGETNFANDTLTFRVTALNQWATKSILLEAWTATWCSQCPPANTTGNALNSDPRIVVAKHHAEDQFSSGASTAFFAPYGVDFTPAGVIDQGEFGAYTPNAATTLWGAEIELRKQGVSPVDLGLTANFNALDRKLTVDMSATYTYGLPGTHAFNVFIVEDGIAAAQMNGPANYLHNQVVRDVLTGVQGDATLIPATPVAGTTYSKTWNFIVPQDWVAQNIRVIGFVSHRQNGLTSTLNVRSTASLVVGVDELENQLGALRAYPNPSTNALWMLWPDAKGNASVQVFALDGREVLSRSVVLNGEALALEGWDSLLPGAYLLQVQQGDHILRVQVVKE